MVVVICVRVHGHRAIMLMAPKVWLQDVVLYVTEERMCCRQSWSIYGHVDQGIRTQHNPNTARMHVRSVDPVTWFHMVYICAAGFTICSRLANI